MRSPELIARPPARPTARLIFALALACGLAPASPTSATDVSPAAAGVVVAAHPAAAEAGQRVLDAGGNAVDAAVAVALTLGVAEPWGSGLGGKVVLLFAEAGTGRVHALEALDQAGSTLDTETFIALSKARRSVGSAAVGVPGMLAGWAEAHRRWGTRPWAELVQPAIDAATRGVVFDHFDASALKAADAKLTAGGGRAVFRPGDAPPVPGDRVAYPDLAATLTTLRDGGAAALYGGELGRRMAEHVAGGGGHLTIDDLVAYRPAVSEAVAFDYAGRRVHAAAPPATGGATLLLALAALNTLDAPHAPEDGAAADSAARLAERVEAEARVLFQIYPKVRRALGSRGDGAARLAEMMTPAGVAEIVEAARDFDPDSVAAGPPAGASPATAAAAAARDPGCTSHFVVVDRRGNVVCATQSLGHHYGSGVVIPGTGIVMNNVLTNFAVKTPSSPNYTGPGLRPRSAMTPVIVTDGGRPVLAVGAAGGQRIPTAVLRVVRDVLDGEATLDRAVHRPRVHARHALSGTDRLEIDLEPGPGAEELRDALKADGWRPRVLPGRTMYFGGVNAAAAGDDGRWIGVADDRRSNAARPVTAATP